jgi:hypothetical protein
MKFPSLAQRQVVRHLPVVNIFVLTLIPLYSGPALSLIVYSYLVYNIHVDDARHTRNNAPRRQNNSYISSQRLGTSLSVGVKKQKLTLECTYKHI